MKKSELRQIIREEIKSQQEPINSLISFLKSYKITIDLRVEELNNIGLTLDYYKNKVKKLSKHSEGIVFELENPLKNKKDITNISKNIKIIIDNKILFKEKLFSFLK